MKARTFSRNASEANALFSQTTKQSKELDDRFTSPSPVRWAIREGEGLGRARLLPSRGRPRLGRSLALPVSLALPATGCELTKRSSRCAASTCPACNGLGGTALVDTQCCCVRSVRDKRKSEPARSAQDHRHAWLDLEGEDISARRMVNRERSMGWLTRNEFGMRIRKKREIKVGIARDLGRLLFRVWCGGRRNDGGLGCLGAERSLTRGPICGLVGWMNRQGGAGSVRGSVRRTAGEIVPATGQCAPGRKFRQQQCNSHSREKTKPGAIWKRSH